MKRAIVGTLFLVFMALSVRAGWAVMTYPPFRADSNPWPNSAERPFSEKPITGVATTRSADPHAERYYNRDYNLIVVFAISWFLGAMVCARVLWGRRGRAEIGLLQFLMLGLIIPLCLFFFPATLHRFIQRGYSFSRMTEKFFFQISVGLVIAIALAYLWHRVVRKRDSQAAKIPQ